MRLKQFVKEDAPLVLGATGYLGTGIAITMIAPSIAPFLLLTVCTVATVLILLIAFGELRVQDVMRSRGRTVGKATESRDYMRKDGH